MFSQYNFSNLFKQYNKQNFLICSIPNSPMLYSESEHNPSQHSYRPKQKHISTVYQKSSIKQQSKSNQNQNVSIITVNPQAHEKSSKKISHASSSSKSKPTSIRSKRVENQATMAQIMKFADQKLKNLGKEAAFEYLETVGVQRAYEKQFNKDDKNSILFTCAVLAHQLLNYPKARRYYQAVIQSSRSQKKNILHYESMMGLACLFEDFKENENAQIVLLETINQYTLQSAPYFNLGNIYKRTGNFTKSLECYKMCIKKFKENKNKKNEFLDPPSDDPEADCLHNSAVVLNLLDQVEEAEEIFKIITHKFNDRISSQLALCEILYSNYQSKATNLKFAQAQKILDKINQFAQKKGIKQSELIVVYQHKANILRKMGKYLQARKFYKKGLQKNSDALNKNYGRIRLDYCELLIQIEQYKRAKEQLNEILSVSQQNPVALTYKIIASQIQDMMESANNMKKNDKMYKVLTLSPKLLEMISRLDQIMYPSIIKNPKKKWENNQEEDIMNNFELNYNQNLKKLNFQEVQKSDQFNYQNALANTHSIKISKLKIIKCFVSYWLPIIIKAIDASKLLDSFDENNTYYIREILKMIIKEKNPQIQRKETGTDSISNANLPSRRKNSSTRESQPDKNLYEKSPVDASSSKLDRQIRQYPSLRDKNKTKQQNQVKSHIGQLKDQFYMLIKKFWILFGVMMLQKGSPLQQSLKKEGQINSRNNLDDLPMKNKILKRAKSDLSLFSNQKMGNKVKEQEIFKGEYLQKFANIHKVIQYLEDQLDNNEVLCMLFKQQHMKQKDRPKSISSTKLLRSQSSKSIPKLQNSRKRLVLTQDFVDSDYQKILKQQSAKTMQEIYIETQKQIKQNFTASDYLIRKATLFSEQLQWDYERFFKILATYYCYPSQKNYNQFNIVYRIVKKVAWLLAVTLHEIYLEIKTSVKKLGVDKSVDYEEMEIQNENELENEEFVMLKYCGFLDRVSFITEVGNIPPEASIKFIAKTVCRLAGQKLGITTVGVVEQIHFFLNEKYQQEYGNSSTNYLKQQFIARQVSEGICESFGDKQIKKVMGECEFENSPQHEDNEKKTFLFSSFGQQPKNNYTKLPSLIIPPPNISAKVSSLGTPDKNISAIQYLPSSWKQALSLCSLIIQQIIKSLGEEKEQRPISMSLGEFIKRAIRRHFVENNMKYIIEEQESSSYLSNIKSIQEKEQLKKEQNKRETLMTQDVQGRCPCPRSRNQLRQRCVLM